MQTRLTAILAAFLTAVALLAGCSKSEESTATDLPDAATLLQQSAETTRGESSVHLLLRTTGELEELPIHSLEGDLTNTPAVAAEGKTTVTVMGQKVEDMPFVVADGDLYAALFGDAISLIGPAADIYDGGAILDPERGLANVLSNFSDAKSVDREKVNDVETVKITGKVSADAVNRIAPQLAVQDAVGGTAWIADGGDHELVQVQLEPRDGVTVTMTLSDWGKPVTVTKPAA